MSIPTAAERVARGAGLLDKERPGWALRISLDVLDLSDSCRCVLGQIYRAPQHAPGEHPAWGDPDGYDTGAEVLHLSPAGLRLHGFDIFAHSNSELDELWAEDIDELWAELDELWISEIRKRQDNAR